MNIKKIGFVLLALLCVVPTSAFAAPTRLSYEDLGLLQLMVHDTFRVSRTLGVNQENGKMDLSTVLDFGTDRISLGGEIRNSENIMVFSVAKRFGDEYLTLVRKGFTPTTARKVVVSKYKTLVKGAYVRLMQDVIPTPVAGTVTMTEDLALRVIHDLIPGTVLVNGTPTPIFSPTLVGRTLSSTDLKNPGAIMDGQFDPAFRAITIFIPPSTTFVIDLLERDQSFGVQFNTDFSFDFFLAEASNGKLEKTDKVSGYIRSVFAKALAN